MTSLYSLLLLMICLFQEWLHHAMLFISLTWLASLTFVLTAQEFYFS